MPEETVPAPEMPMYQATLDKMALARNATAGLIGYDNVAYHPSVTEQLEMAKATLLAQIHQIDAALEQAKKNQGAMDLIDAIAKTGKVGR